MIDTFIGLGANIGDPGANLLEATQQMAHLPNTRFQACSRVYQSSPMGPQDQPDFLNAAIHLQTALPPLELLKHLQTLENNMGRVKVRHWGERCIDLDVLLFGDVTLTSEHLTLPHPGVHERAFVLQPLQDLLGPNYRMPNGEEIGTLLAACPDNHLAVTHLDLKPDLLPGDPR